MKTGSRKAIGEKTIGRAAALADHWRDENRGPTPEEKATFDALLDSAEVALGCGPIPRQTKLFDMFVANMDGGDGLHSGDVAASMFGGSTKSNIKLFDERGRCYRGLTNKESFADAVREQANITGAARNDHFGDKFVTEGLTLGGMLRASVVGGSSIEMAALQSGSGSSGGFNVPEYLAAQVIDKLVAKTVLLRAGALRVPIEGDTRFVRVTGHPTADWRRERNTISESEPTFGAIDMHPKSLAVIVRVTRELLQDGRNVAQIIENAITSAFAVEVDRVGLLGSGNEEPVGLYNESPAINEQASVGTPTSFDEILDGLKLMKDDNAMDPTALIMSPREWLTYAKLADTTGQPLQRPPAIADLPFEVTSAVPTNLGGGGAESVMFAGHFPEFIFGIRSELQIEVLRELYAATGEIGFAAHMRLDTGLMHAESFVKYTGVTAT